jgi:hypothetical protein
MVGTVDTQLHNFVLSQDESVLGNIEVRSDRGPVDDFEEGWEIGRRVYDAVNLPDLSNCVG